MTNFEALETKLDKVLKIVVDVITLKLSSPCESLAPNFHPPPSTPLDFRAQQIQTHPTLLLAPKLHCTPALLATHSHFTPICHISTTPLISLTGFSSLLYKPPLSPRKVRIDFPHFDGVEHLN